MGKRKCPKKNSKSNVYNRAFRFGKTREELKQQLKNFCTEFIRLKSSRYDTVTPNNARDYLLKFIHTDNSFNGVGLTIYDLEQNTKKARELLLSLRRRLNKSKQ